ncbi:unnamed protein product [Rotaria sp. Silwood1]|nr:unnamed protein product [Rotaria sp. Silwood1]
MTAWDNEGLTQRIDVPISLRSASVLSMTSNNFIVPFSSNYLNINQFTPSQCTSYNTLNDITRFSNYTGCCPCDSGLSGWYKNDTLSSTVGATSAGTQCASYSANLCPPSYSVSSVLATNCNGYYVFYFIPLSCACCSSIYPRYCTI